MDSIPYRVTGTVTNPYARIEIPPIGRVLEAIQARAAALGQRTIQVSNRQLAAAAGCSASLLPGILRQLAADGHVSYDPAAGLVMINQVIDQSTDRPAPASAAPCGELSPADQPDDRVKKACMDHETHDQQQQQQIVLPVVTIDFPGAPANERFYQDLIADEVNPRDAWAIADRFPERTIGMFRTEVERATAMGKTSPVGFVIWMWLRGWRVTGGRDGSSVSGRNSAGDGRDRAGRSDRRENRERSDARPRGLRPVATSDDWTLDPPPTASSPRAGDDPGAF